MALRGCCGCDLRTSSLTIGTVFFAISLLHLAIIVGTWATFSSARRDLADAYDIPFATLTTYERLVFVPQLVFALLSLTFNSLLILGTRRSSACAVFAWLLYHAIVFVIFALISVGLLIACGVLYGRYAELREGLDEGVTGGSFAGSRGRPTFPRGSKGAELQQVYVSMVAFGVAGGFGLLLNPLLWYLYVLVQAFLRELSGFGVEDVGNMGGREAKAEDVV